MSRQIYAKKRSRKQKAILALAVFVFLFVLNLVCDLIMLFPFQARQRMETVWEIEKTKVIWEAPTVADDGYRYFIAVNEDVAVFGGRKWHWLMGWDIFGVRLLPRKIQEPLYATHMTISSFERGNSVYLLGCIQDDEISTIEYLQKWEDGAEKRMEIAKESYIYHEGECYYVQKAPKDFWDHPEKDEKIAGAGRNVCAKDREGNVIYTSADSY